MHKTDAGERRIELRKRALERAREAKAAMKAAAILPGAGQKARELQEEADRLRAEAEALKDQARLEDLSIWRLEKVKSTKKSNQTRNVHWEAVQRWMLKLFCKGPR